MAVQIMLGPQSPKPNLVNSIDELGTSGSIVTITAGWRDSEGEIEDLQAEIGRPISDLKIYHRAERIFAQEQALHALQRERQDKLLELQSLYRIRLNPAMAVARKLMRSTGDAALVRQEQNAAISHVRALDRNHVRNITSIHNQFDQRRADLSSPLATEQKAQVQEMVSNADLVLIAGGHVAVLLNRIRLFRLQELLMQKPVIAWSAGAMVLCERIVLFHDDAPQGKRDAEVLDAGLGIVGNHIPLPYAQSRLDWSNRTRMAVFSRRFSPAKCCTLDSGSMLRLEHNRIIRAEGSWIITPSGRKKELTTT